MGIVRRATTCVVAALLLLACGDDATPVDGGTDTGTDSATAAGPNIPWLADGVPPVALTPCPTGWREVEVGGLTQCEPFPEGGPGTCAAGEAHFPGEPGCRAVGATCPAGELPEGLPSSNVVYIDDDAAAGGDGSAASPFASLSEVGWGSLASGTTVALAKGSYDGSVPLRAGVHVVGACARDTVLTGVAAPVVALVTVTNAGEAARLTNVSISGAPQQGVRVERGRSLIAEGVIVDGAEEYAVFAMGADTMLTLEDVLIRDTQLSAMGFGFGLGVGIGARVEGRRLVIAENRVGGITMGGDGAELLLEDTVVRDTLPDDTGRFGRAIDVSLGASLTASRLAVLSNLELGLGVLDPGSSANLTDVVLRGTEPQPRDDRYGRGITVELGARLTASRLVVDDNHEAGVYASGADTEVTVDDAVFRGTRPTASTGEFGRGVDVVLGARFTGTRILIEGSHDGGMNVALDSAAVLTDVAVLDTQPDDIDRFGRAITVQEGSRLDASRLFTRGSRELGITSVQDATVVLEDVVVQDVATSACASPECGDVTLGHAVVTMSAEMRLTRFAVRGAQTCGVFLVELPGDATPTSLDLTAGTISESEIGVCLQVSGYDVSRLQNAVEYRDNGVNLDTTMLPVPDPPGTLRP